MNEVPITPTALPDPGLVQREHVGVALDEDRAAGLRRGGARAVDPVQHAALVVELVRGRVDVLRLALGLVHRPRAEPEHAAARVGGREHDPAAEEVVDCPGRSRERRTSPAASSSSSLKPAAREATRIRSQRLGA